MFGSTFAACATGNYEIVLLQYITVYEDGSEPTLNFANHCGSFEKPCSTLESEIKYCKSRNIKVILSIRRIEASQTQTTVNSVEAARKLAAFLWNNYLSSKYGPLGQVALDGINILDVPGGENLRWEEILNAVNEFSTTERKIYLAASPQCNGIYLSNAINTGLIDYAFMLFYYDPGCSYDRTRKDATSLLNSWQTWITLSDKLVFMGLPASPDATGGSGYVEPNALKRDILPAVKQAPNYGGILLFDRAEDV
ncbi:hypothetical protein L6164_008789 [Bauhinia variegata]|uniref:Uncharacterized protein n=1 Tax=Bauhinia variegata TaxID=167791 RepID=A0ACB9PHU1_BAUVA|nr:hypothetical protein L6164_008789 [Bauhinia variegata]